MSEPLWTKVRTLEDTKDEKRVVEVIEKLADDLDVVMHTNPWHGLYLDENKAYAIRVTVEEIE